MKVLNFGSLNIDYVYSVDHFVQRGETLLSDNRETFVGGKGLNQSIALARAGLPTYHAGLVGAEGRFLIDFLSENSVNTQYTGVLGDVPSGHAVIQNSKDGDNCILLYGGANQAITRDFADEVLNNFEEGDVIVLQNEISNLQYIMGEAVRRKMRIVLNPSPANEALRKLPLEKVTYMILNEIEAGVLTDSGTEDENVLIPLLEKQFPNTEIVLTLGKRGSVYAFHGKKYYQDIINAEVVDTTAAGDTFSGFFLGAILSGRTPQEALYTATKASSITVSRKGAAPSIPTREEVMR